MPLLRLVTMSDAAELASLQSADRDFLAHWNPIRTEAFFTEAGQRESIDRALAGFGAGLHRLGAATLLDNRASQRVLAPNGFTRFGRAPGYTKIAGRWQEHDLFQRLNE